MIHLREHWEGVSLSGDYTLEQWLGGDERAAFFQTSLAPDGRPAVVKLVPEADADGAALLDLWHRTRQLRHPNLIEILDYGRADHRGEIVLYAVYESPDDTLAAALSRSPLNREEAREVLDAALDALRYLHAQGLVLGVLDPDHIVAVGDRIKLSTGTLSDADTSSAYREDVRLLGVLWQHDLMSASPKSAEIAPHAADPDPHTRWTLAEIGDALNPPLPPLPPPLPKPAPPLIVSSPISVSPVIVRKDAARSFPKWILVGTAGLLLVIFALHRQRPDTDAIPSRVASVSLATETPSPAPVSKPKPATAAGKEMWRVIAFTYRTRDDAARKAQQLNQQHPGLNATVFRPKDKQGYYLVSLGGRVTYEEALRLQRSARAKGLPRDLYVQNYLE